MPRLVTQIYKWIFGTSGLLMGRLTQIVFNVLEERYSKKLYTLNI